jgi:hypothetical protein
MPAPNRDTVLKVLREAIDFTRRVGANSEADALEPYYVHFQKEKPTLKAMRGPLQAAKDKAAIRITKILYDERRDPRPGMETAVQEYERIWVAFGDLIYPPLHTGMSVTEIAGLAGNKESTTVLGDPTAAKSIAEHSLEVVERFSKAVFKQDIETAYGLCANELRMWMSVKRLVTDLQKADAQFGGPAVDLMIERITWIYADEPSRQRGNSHGDWPKDTPKSNKRALVGTYWFTNKKTQQGRWVFFWVTEEAAGYRIAKFNQYLQ